MPNSKIKSIKAKPYSKISLLRGREILDSRGNPTVEVELETNLGIFSASVPSGASKGKYEAYELRDGGKRYGGKGVLKAIKNIEQIIAPKLMGKDVTKQNEIDSLMIDLDGTENKFNLGTNAILAVSIAVCRAGAAVQNLPPYQYIARLVEAGSLPAFPLACFNIINGGVHAGSELTIQEFMVVPQSSSFSENLRMGSEIYYNLKEILIKKFGKLAINVGDEGGFVPPISKTNQALDLIMKAINNFPESKIGIDCAASQFYQAGKYHLDSDIFDGNKLLKFYKNLIKKYPVIFLEDPFSEEDWEAWQIANCKLQIAKFLIIGDDLTVTNTERIKLAYKKKACNAIIIKPNQIGTISEVLEAVELAKSYGWKIIVSHRSGETNDDFISDLAVGIGADFIKAGAPFPKERMVKYKRLAEIEEEIQK